MDIKLKDLLFEGIHLQIPDPEAVKLNYNLALKAGINTPVPYWSKVWPSAKALCTYIVQHPNEFAHKRVMELGAGLALPSFVVAQFANSVEASDYIPEAIDCILSNIALNGLRNMTTRLLNWTHLLADEYPEVVLLSDINYEPASFEALYQLIVQLIEAGVCIYLATPQRLQAAVFVHRIQHYIFSATHTDIEMDNETTTISIFQLQK
jgi:predicted nicotinamide N-methyase